MTKWEVINADVIEWAESYDGLPFHACLCDAPYHLTTITKRFGKEGSASAKYGRDGAFQRVSKGFLGQEWDGSMVSFQPETWDAIDKHLYPGAFLMTFAGARTYHRIACAVEDGGFIIHPLIGWINSQSLPKATRIDTQVDKAAGKDREVIATVPQRGAKFKLTETLIDNMGFNDPERTEFEITTPATDLARIWEGYRYGLQALRGNLEPICCAQKPYEGRPVDCITNIGAGAFWIDGGRLGYASDIDCASATPQGKCTARSGRLAGKVQGGGKRSEFERPRQSGRWPSNITMSHHPSCIYVGARQVQNTSGDIAPGTKGTGPRNNEVYGEDKRDRGAWKKYGDANGNETVAAWSCHPDCMIRKLDEEVGNRPGCKSPSKAKSQSIYRPNQGNYMPQGTIHPDKGGPSRFFFNADWAYEIEERLVGLDLPVKYVPKVAPREKNAGCSDFYWRRHDLARITREEWEHLDKKKRTEGCIHPTLKPIKLTQWLATLLLPPPEYAPRRIIVPFAGVMSEAIGCLLAGWDEVVAIEMNANYCSIGEARLRWWQHWHEQSRLDKPKAIMKFAEKHPESVQAQLI